MTTNEQNQNSQNEQQETGVCLPDMEALQQALQTAQKNVEELRRELLEGLAELEHEKRSRCIRHAKAAKKAKQ